MDSAGKPAMAQGSTPNGKQKPGGLQIQILEDPTKMPRMSHRKSHHHPNNENIILCKIRAGWRGGYHVLGLRHWGFVFFMVAYAFAGGAIFSYLEKNHLNETRKMAIYQLSEERLNLIELISNMTNVTDEIALELEIVLDQYQRFKGLYPKMTINWDIWDGVFYSFTIFSTIGYGHFFPVTRYGQIATMIYALFGIPLVLAVLADFGKLLTRYLKQVYSMVRHMLVHLWRMAKYKRLKARGEDLCIGQKETQQDVAQFDFPIPLAIGMVVAWLFMCTAVCRIWETEWDYFETFYFFFISLSTIGLGDLTPAHPKYMLASFPAILIGLTLISLVINLIQNKIDQWREKAQEMFEDQLGLDTVSASECYEEEQETGDISPEPQSGVQPTPPAVHIMKEKLDRVALGVLQTMTLRPKRRRIGTQTVESYVRDVLHARPSDKVQSDGVIHPSPEIGRRTGNEDYDTASATSASLLYFDTISDNDTI